MKALLGLFFAAASFFGAVVLFNTGIVDIQFEEIRYRIGTVAAMENASADPGIVARYESIKRRIIKGADGIPGLKSEEPPMEPRRNKSPGDRVDAWRFDALHIPIRHAVRVIEFTLGKSAIHTGTDDMILEVLEIGYGFERIQRYSEALSVYDAVIATIGVTPGIKAAVMMHKAFCHSMLGDYRESRAIYEQTITLFPDSDAGILCWKLLDYVVVMEHNRAAIEKKTMPPLKKADQSYLDTDYRNAIRNYSKYLLHEPFSATAVRARYCKGIAHEKLGEIRDAEKEYSTVRRIGGNGQWAKPADRRLIAIRHSDGNRTALLDEARRRLEAYHDQVFLANVPNYSKFVPGGYGDILRTANERRHSVIDGMLRASLNIDSCAVSDEAIAEEQRKKIDSLRNVLLEHSFAGREERKNRSRWSLISGCYFRRPAVLRAAIEGRSEELRRIADKRERNGAKISGKLLVGIVIEPTGAVGAATVVRSTISDQRFEASVVNQIRNWSFSAVPKSIGSVDIRYPFSFGN